MRFTRRNATKETTYWVIFESNGGFGYGDSYGSDSSDGDSGGGSGGENPAETTCGNGYVYDAVLGTCVEDFFAQDVWNEQEPYDKWNELTNCEKDFFRNNSHHLYNAKANRAVAENAAYMRFGQCKTPNNTHPLYQTIGDAYRHAYFSSLNTHIMGYQNAKKLGDAHECNPNTSFGEDKAMDLHNNAWGYLYGTTFSIIDENQFYKTFMNAYKNGQIKTLIKCQ